MSIFKIFHVRTREVSIEEGKSIEEACGKAGWKKEECKVQEISEEGATAQNYFRL